MVADSSGNGNAGTVSGATWTSVGKYGSALSFNGSSARVNVANSASLQLSGGMTLEAWVDPASVTNVWRDVIYKGNDNYYLEATSMPGSLPAGGGIMGGGYGEAYGAAKLAANSWSYLAVTYDGSAVRLYVNGSLVSSTPKTGALATSTNQLQIGGDSLYGQYFSGLIDEVRIYNVALSAGQIQTDMATPIGGATSDTQPPSQPGTLGASAVSSGRVDLSWGASTDNVGVTGYQIERCQGSGCSNFGQIATTAATATSYSDSSVSASTSYSYRLRATDAAGNTSPYTNTATTTTPSPALHSVGGTVSGLSGALVLENNNGDDLNVASNGPFSFGTRLPDGATYRVTVKTPPPGQTCTVSGGSGTIAGADVTNVAVACTSSSGTFDDFNRSDGSLGAAWTPISDGSLSIGSGVAVGTSGQAGDMRSGETYGSDQYSRIEVVDPQIGDDDWIGPAVRMQSGGQDMYAGIYFGNDGHPQLRLYVRVNGAWAQLGSSYNCGFLPAGTTLELTEVGSTIELLQNGTERIAATDTSISGGSPGIATFGPARLDNWAGGNTSTAPPRLQVDYDGTNADGVASYDVTSSDDGGTHVMRVLAPTNPAPGVPHNFLYVLPVEAELGSVYGDGLESLRALGVQNQYNLTIIEPSFGIEPWYADNPIDSTVEYDTFLTNDLAPWVAQNLGETGNEQNWLIGFSKSGVGAIDLILRHPGVFTLAAAWDFPADMSTYDQFGASSADAYGTDANFQANYRLTPAFVAAHKAPFVSQNRLWIGGYQTFQTDMSDFDVLLTSDAILHTTETPTPMAHRWDSGWTPIALAALHQESMALAPGP